MPADPKDITERLAEAVKNHFERFVPPFADRLDVSWRFWSLAEHLAQVRVRDFEPQSADVILYGTATRGTKAYKAVLYLCGLGFGPQAMILCRSLIEDALVARWTELHRDEALERIQRHEQHMLYLLAETVRERELDLGALAALDPLSEEELERASKDFGSYGQLSWTGHRNIVSLFNAVEPEWGDENEHKLLAHIRSIALRYANLTTHNTAASIIKPTYLEDGTPFYNAGESADDIGGALLLGFWAFGNLNRVVLYGSQREEFEAFYREHMMEFFQPNP